MAEYATLNEAMAAGDELAEAEIRYRMLAEAFTELPQLRSQLNGQIERAKAEIMRLRATKDKPQDSATKTAGNVVAFDANRFQKSG